MQGDLAKTILQRYGGDYERLVIHSHHGCNLRCSGCNHHSENLDPNEHIDIDALIKDLQHLISIVDIRLITVLGGEPLLNPEGTYAVCKFLLDNNKRVKLVTNGYYLNKNEDWIFECIERGMTLKISVHPSTQDKGRENLNDKIISFSKKAIANNIKFQRRNTIYTDQDYSWIEISPEFERKEMWFHLFKYDGDKVYPYNSVKEEAFKICESSCPTLYKGKMYKCAHSAYFKEQLAIRGQLDDPEWQRYLSSKGADIHNETEMSEFNRVVYEPEDICSSCPSTPEYITINQDSSIKKKMIPIVSL
jgi:organic radical activating enzyme